MQLVLWNAIGTTTTTTDGDREVQPAIEPDDVSDQAKIRGHVWRCRCGQWIDADRCGWCGRRRVDQARAAARTLRSA